MRSLLSVAKFTCIILFNTAAHQEENAPLGALKTSASVLKNTCLEQLYILGSVWCQNMEKHIFQSFKIHQSNHLSVPVGFIDPPVFKKQLVFWI